MSSIKFLALGGLGESGKNLYCLEVDDDIFILDAGIKEPSQDLYGIGEILPNLSYLKENASRVKAIFLSHGHDEHMGAVLELLKFLNVGVFSSHFTISLLEDMIKDAGLNLEDYRLYRINENKTLSFGKVEVVAYFVAHSIPEALNFCFKTVDGNIYYAPDFTFDVGSNKKYHTSIDKIASLASGNTLLVMAESIGTLNYDRVNNDTSLDYLILEALKEKQRLIFLAYSEELSRIQKIIDLSISKNRRVAIIGAKAQKIISKAKETGYLEIPEERLVSLKYIDDINGKKLKHRNDDKDLVVIVTGSKHKPFYTLQRMCRGEDRLIEVTKDDHIIIMSLPNSSNERCYSIARDEVYRVGARYTEVTRKILKSTHADLEDLKLLYSMLNPKYVIPIEGSERHFYTHKEAVEETFPKTKVVILENGQVALFSDGNFGNANQRVKVGYLTLDEISGGINSRQIIADREMMASDGLCSVSVVVDKEGLRLLSLPSVSFKGVGDNLDEVKDEIISCVIGEIQVQFNRHKFVDFDYMKDRIEQAISYIINNKTNKRPKVVLNFVPYYEN